jgi:hypothetical protein
VYRRIAILHTPIVPPAEKSSVAFEQGRTDRDAAFTESEFGLFDGYGEELVWV